MNITIIIASIVIYLGIGLLTVFSFIKYKKTTDYFFDIEDNLGILTWIWLCWIIASPVLLMMCIVRVIGNKIMKWDK